MAPDEDRADGWAFKASMGGQPKDNAGRFPGNKLWGDGWGWSWFDATNPQKTTSTDYTTDCQSCHEPARQSDWIYTRGYPVLN
jgi:Cytochrome P460